MDFLSWCVGAVVGLMAGFLWALVWHGRTEAAERAQVAKYVRGNFEGPQDEEPPSTWGGF